MWSQSAVKIAFFDDRFDMVYGAQENLLLLAELATQAGHQTTLIVTSGGRLADAATARGLPVEVVQAPDRLLLFERQILSGGPRTMLRTAAQVVSYGRSLSRHLRSASFDVAVAAAVRPGLLMWWVGLRRRPPVITWAQTSTPLGALAAIVGVLSWRVGLISDGAVTTFPPLSRRLLRRKFRPLPSGREMSRYSAATVSRPSSDSLEIVTICSITPRKGLSLLLMAIASAELPNARLTVVGGTTGPKSEVYMTALKDQAERLGLNVRFVGWQDDVVPYLSVADIFALASEDEGLPGVLLEALAVGVACVTTRAGGAGDLVERCDGGLAVDVGDEGAFTAALKLLADDGELRAALARRGAANVRSMYSLEAFYEGFDRLLRELGGR